MALTISEIVKGNAGSLRIHVGTITFGVGASGTSIGVAAGAGPATLRFGGQREVANAVDLSAVVSRFVAIGV